MDCGRPVLPARISPFGPAQSKAAKHTSEEGNLLLRNQVHLHSRYNPNMRGLNQLNRSLNSSLVRGFCGLLPFIKCR